MQGPGPDGQPTGAPIRTYDYAPHAGGADFDDSRWQAVDPTTLVQRRSTGRICFNWYRINLTIPNHVGSFNPGRLNPRVRDLPRTAARWPQRATPTTPFFDYRNLSHVLQRVANITGLVRLVTVGAAKKSRAARP